MEKEKVIAYKDFDYSDGCDIIYCDMCGEKTVVPSWCEECPECGYLGIGGYLGIDGIEEGLTLEEVEEKYHIVWKDGSREDRKKLLSVIEGDFWGWVKDLAPRGWKIVVAQSGENDNRAFNVYDSKNNLVGSYDEVDGWRTDAGYFE